MPILLGDMMWGQGLRVRGSQPRVPHWGETADFRAQQESASVRSAQHEAWDVGLTGSHRPTREPVRKCQRRGYDSAVSAPGEWCAYEAGATDTGVLGA